MKPADQLVDLLYPTACLGCGRAGGEFICAGCLERVAGHRVSVVVGRPKERLFEVRGAGEYSGLLKDAVLRLKSGSRACAGPLSVLMAAAAGNEPRYVAPGPVCCVPSTRKKVVERGYNPAELLAGKVAGLLGRPFIDCLRKTAVTADQDTLGADARWENVTGTHCVRDQFTSSGRVLLVDDVLTTGATASDCAEALVSAGVDEVVVLVAAVAAPRCFR